MNGRRICGWCKHIIGPAATERDTHGICPACLSRELAELALGPIRGGVKEVSHA